MNHRILWMFAVAFWLTVLKPTPAREIVDYSSQRIAAGQWDVVDIRFTASEIPPQPWDVELTGRFTSAEGQRIEVAGFYDGKNNFVLRFTPPEPGLWAFEIQSSIAEFAGKTGELDVSSATNRPGGVVVDSNSERQFAYQNGKPYYPIAFEADWLFALDADNPSDIPKTRQLVDTLSSNGFNQVVMNVFAYDVQWPKDERLETRFDYGSPDAFPFLGNNQSPDFSQLNPEYFRRLDRVVDYLDEKNIVAHLMIYVWNKRVAWPQANSLADNRYFEYVARRYQAYPNLVWDVSKEALGYGHTDVNYITDRIQRLRKLDSFDRLITVHDYSYCRRFPKQVDFVSVQLWQSELYSVMRKVLKDIPGKPILNIEHGGYERGPYEVFNGNYTSPEVCLERAYQCVFAGTFPTHYWQCAAWNVVIPDVEALPADDRPRLEYYRYMREFVERFRVDQLKAGDKKSNAGFSLHNGDDLIVYYVPKECDFLGLRLPKDKAGAMQLMWLDPLTGKYSEPFEQKITQWPTVQVPKSASFQILICRLK